jgi:hypothetical protein
MAHVIFEGDPGDINDIERKTEVRQTLVHFRSGRMARLEAESSRVSHGRGCVEAQLVTLDRHDLPS